MKSEAYWKKRSALLMYDRMEGAEEVSAEIAEVYRHAYNQLAHDISGLFDEFQTKYKLTNDEAMRILNSMSDPGDIEQLMTALQNAGTEEALQLKAILDSPEYQRKIARFQAIQEEVNEISTKVYKQDLSKQRKWYTNLCSDTYYQTIFDVQNQVGFQFSFAHVSDKLIRSVMNSSWSGASYSDRLWKNVDGVAKEVRKQLTWGIISGKHERQMAKEIANKFAVGAFESRRLVRTESCYLSNEMQFQAYQECGADRYQYIATLDSRTDEECGALDRKVFEISEKVPGLNAPPMHPFCRCTTRIYIDQNERTDLKRRARNPKTGKNEIVSANISYNEWAEQNGLRKPIQRPNTEKNVSKATSQRHTVVQGKDIVDTWERRPDKFQFEIEDVIDAQGFNGLPKVVPVDEFDKYVNESNLIMMRGYKAPDEETLKAYQEQLYHGKWYVDCSNGGARYGQGMYTSANFSGQLTPEVKSVGASYGRDGMIETLTMDKSSKFVNYRDLTKQFRKTGAEDIFEDIGSYAAACGYDGIICWDKNDKAVNVVVLNRTKCIFKGGA